MDGTEYDAFCKRLLDVAVSHIATIHWLLATPDGSRVTRNGTAFFVHTSAATFGVTAAHVIEGWLSLCKTQGPTALKLTGCSDRTIALAWEDRKIDIHGEVDIATFALTATEIDSLGSQPFKVTSALYPVQMGDKLAYCGVPGSLTSATPERVNFGALRGMGEVSAINEISLRMQIERSRLKPLTGMGVPPENFNFGGLSGGPLFRVFKDRQEPMTLEGVIIEGPNTCEIEGESIPGFELISARPFRFIDVHGAIEASAWNAANPLPRATATFPPYA